MSISSRSKGPQPPSAKRVPFRLEEHGHVRVDDYYWLRERQNADVVRYLTDENAYADEVMAHTKPLEEQLFQEIKGRIKQSDWSVPFKMGAYYYYVRYEPEREYGIYCRKYETLENPEEVMLDGNVLAQDCEYFSLGNWMVSSRQDFLAYAVDTQGRRIYTLYFKNLVTGEVLNETISNVTGNMDWANDNRTIFYSKQDPDTLRSCQVWRHVLGTEPEKDKLVYEEKDETFSTYVFKTKSKQYLMIASHQTVSSEYRFLDAYEPSGEFRVFHPRSRGHEYDVDHFDGKFYIRTNYQATNFRLLVAPVEHHAIDHWAELIPHRDEVLLEGIELFSRFLVVEERIQGLIHLRIIPWDGGKEHEIDFGEPAYYAAFGDNYEMDASTLRFGYTSMTTPMSIYDYDMETKERVLLKQEEVLGGFCVSKYRTERLHATAKDGTFVPISIVYHQGFVPDSTAPLLLYGYGSYGASMDASFSSARLSLLDRGFVFAIAHIRGGEELGRAWYEQGKLFQKKNTFDDFIACAEYLLAHGYGNPKKFFAMGGSAGGLLIGAIANQRPDLFTGVVAQVPFVDVVTTMLDETIPLTTGEYDEWGNPHQKPDYDYMLSYSPYDNVEAKAYPHMYVTTGLHDSQVQYWEPAKWVAKLRTLKTDKNRLILRTNMDAGHGGASGRFKRYRETASTYAFLLDLAGISR
ncbi:MAG: S9 family peptidase [Nitrospirales bacterium]|nr:S9 family peptidase [Nitrospira sp.]MDR4503021.1 S9 family peptidase [Nitrospirales bacterium]